MRLEFVKMASATTGRQTGSALLVSMFMLLIVLAAGASMAGIGFMEEKAARNERDRIIALQSAELALADAEMDIENSTASSSRSFIFSPTSSEGFAEPCGQGDSNIYQGLCLPSQRSLSEITMALSSTGSQSQSVPFGRFTGQTMPIGNGPLPFQLPRYVIELIKDNAPGQVTEARYLYRITAIGFGADSHTRIMLQSIYRKAAALKGSIKG